MERYIREKLAKIKIDSTDTHRILVLRHIYDELEAVGYSTKEIKRLIDKVVMENIKNIASMYIDKLEEDYEEDN